MAKPLLPDELWELVEPLLPKHEPSPNGGHPRVPDRVCLTGLLFALKTGIPWEDFPAEMGCCGMTLLNRLREWQAAGVWQRVHELLLAGLRAADLIDLERVVVDASFARARTATAVASPKPLLFAIARPSPGIPSASHLRRSRALAVDVG